MGSSIGGARRRVGAPGQPPRRATKHAARGARPRSLPGAVLSGVSAAPPLAADDHARGARCVAWLRRFHVWPQEPPSAARSASFTDESSAQDGSNEVL
jgi:hypothetical protein